MPSPLAAMMGKAPAAAPAPMVKPPEPGGDRTALAGQMMAAFKSGDVTALDDALHAYFTVCQSEYDEPEPAPTMPGKG